MVLADRGASVALYDIDATAVDRVSAGDPPFHEPGLVEALSRVRRTDRLEITTDRAVVSDAAAVIVVVGTPVDDHLNPDLAAVPEAVAGIAPHLRDGQVLILRSTLYPGVTGWIERQMAGLGLDIEVAFCPERIAEGRALDELTSLPQIIGARSDRGYDRAAGVFSRLADRLIRLSPEEAELAKLFTNSFRYITFAIANQFFMIANEHGLDYERIRAAVVDDYPRAATLPAAGFAAGPCLFKDTMQLAAFNTNRFTLGNAGMLVNEGLPLYVVERMAQRFDLPSATVGICGMAFKGESDDARSSLSYKLKRILSFTCQGVLTSDPYVITDPDLVDLDTLLAESDIVVIGAPHHRYRDLSTTKPVIDIWNITGQGVLV